MVNLQQQRTLILGIKSALKIMVAINDTEVLLQF